MKLDRLYTREQFDQILKERFEATSPVMKNAVGRECFELELKFGERMGEPLKKEMFVNEREKPTWESVIGMPLISEGVDGKYWRLMKQWQQAEKEAVFEGVDNIIKDSPCLNIIINEEWQIIFYGKCIKLTKLHESDLPIDYGVIKTFHDLAEATKGILIIKNFEIW